MSVCSRCNGTAYLRTIHNSHVPCGCDDGMSRTAEESAIPCATLRSDPPWLRAPDVRADLARVGLARRVEDVEIERPKAQLVKELRAEPLELRRALASLVGYVRDFDKSCAAEIVDAEELLKSTPAEAIADYRRQVEFAAARLHPGKDPNRPTFDELQRAWVLAGQERDEATRLLSESVARVAVLGGALCEAAETLENTHVAHCGPAWTDRGLHAPECLLFEAESIRAALSPSSSPSGKEKA